MPSSTTLFSNNRKVQRARPLGGLEQAKAISLAFRAFSTRRAGLFPFRISVSSRSRSPPLSLTTYFFTEISFAAMIASLASPVVGDESESLNPFELVEAGD